MAQKPKGETEDHDGFKRAIDRQNRLETARDEETKRARDHAEGQAAHRGIPAMERSSKGRPKQRN